MEILSSGWQAAFYIIATVLLAIAAFFPMFREQGDTISRVNIAPLGLACFTFVFAWNALAVATA